MRTKKLAAALVAAQLGALLTTAPAVAAPTFPPSEWVIGADKRIVMITFDGKTRARPFLNVLETLDRKNARASFFIPGGWIQHHKDKARRARVQGHTLGNRGYGDTAFTSMSDDEIRASIERAEDALNAVGAGPKPFLRAPKGQRDIRVLRVAGSAGYRSVRWTFHARGGLARKVKRRVVRAAQRGSIISLDIWRKSHRQALPGIIDGLRRRGFDLRTIDGLTNVHAIRWDVTLRTGNSGPEVKFLQKMLLRNSYPAGAADGSFGYSTLQASYAFEKTKGLARDAVITPAQMTLLAMKGTPQPPRRKPDRYVDVDISRQVLFEVRKGKVKHTLPISSGNEELYTVDGQTRRAHTPRGDFTIERKIAGKRVSHLGTLWWPNYFVGGYAVHGSDSVPTYPASHGCVRIPRYVEQKFFYRNPIGTPLYVHE
ncbi:MAG TPA: polysaccharide deacetylase family protein [Actinomycetota bacterium]|nr:polysaccharide deacetylase family protein [Actinomycetota bacterium]